MICQVWLLCIQSYIQVQLKASIQPNFVEVQNKFFSPEKNTKKKKGVEGEFIRISCFLSYFLSVILSLISSWKQRNGKIETLLKGERLKKDNDRKKRENCLETSQRVARNKRYSSKRCPNWRKIVCAKTWVKEAILQRDTEPMITCCTSFGTWS